MVSTGAVSSVSLVPRFLKLEQHGAHNNYLINYLRQNNFFVFPVALLTISIINGSKFPMLSD